jgi:hypothetical protein
LDNELELNLSKRPKVLDIANAFQDRFGKAIEYRKPNPQDNARLSNALVQEIQRAVDLHPEAKGWYDENIKLTMDVIRDLDSDLAKPENDFIFKVILASTSDGNKVGPQFQQSWKEYSNWKNTGKISGNFVSGDRIENIQGNLKMFNEMVNSIGWEKTKDFFTRKGTVKEVRQALIDTFGWTKKEAQGVGSSELTDEVVPFAVVLGPKLGSFFNNLYGDFSSVTMDRWFMRTIGRLTGTQVAPLSKAKLREMRNNLRDSVSRLTPSEFELLGIKRGDLKGTSIDGSATTISGRFAKKSLRDTAKQSAESGQSALEETRKFANSLKKGLNPLVEAPVDGTHRRWIRERIAEVQKDLRSKGIELENADLQAVLWYLEKELYEKLNYRSKSGESDYASAASSLYQSVVGRPSDVYAGGTGRVRAIGGDGGSNVLDAANGGQAPRQEVSGEQRFMPASDTDYLSAVKKGDTATAQRMVDAAAKAAGYTVGPVFHGSAARFNQFKRAFLGSATGGKSSNEAFFFSTSDKTAKNYASYASEEGPIKELMRKADQAEAKGDWDLYDKLVGQAENLDFGTNAQELRQQRREQSKIYNVYLNGKFLEMDAEGMTPAELSSAKDFKGFDGSLTAALKSAKRKGYDGVVFRNLDDAPNLSDPSDHYAIFDPNKIKLSDAVTKDDAGNVIPLSQRFKATSEDIRFMPETIQRDVGRNQDFAKPPSESQAIEALHINKRSFWRGHADLPEGTAVGVRIDIPAFTDNGVYVQTIHEAATPGNVGDRIGYDTNVRLTGPVKFFVKQGSEQLKSGALAIKEGRANKHPIATVEGNLSKDRSVPLDIEEWTPIGMDPKKHSYFYDKRSGQPVSGGSEAYSVGNTVFVKDPIPAEPKDFRYMPSPDSAMPGAYSFPGGYRALPGKAKGSLRLYGPAGSLIGIASSLDEAQRILRRKGNR